MIPDEEQMRELELKLDGLKDHELSEEQMRELELKLHDLKLKLEDMEPMDIRIEQLPDNPRIHIEKYRIGPVRNDEYGWQRSWQIVKNRFRFEFEELREDFARLRNGLIELSHELMGKSA